MQGFGRRGVLGLDLVRFAAAIAVVMYHLAYWWWLPDITGDQGHLLHEGLAPLREPFRWGWVGVQLFFTLSGFVIAFSANGKTATDFVKGRIKRLYPAAWICASVTLLCVELGRPEALAEYARSMTLWVYGPWISGVYWTLSVEIVFYVAVACMLRAGIKLSNFGMFLGYASTLYWVVRVIDFASGGHARTFLAMTETVQTGRLTLLANGTFFGTGIMLWSLAFDKPSQAQRLSLVTFILASFVAVCAAGHYKVTIEGGAAWRAVEPALLWSVGLVGIILSIRWNDGVWRLLGAYARPIRFVGLATYPLYLVHSEVGQAIMARTLSVGPFASLILSVCVVLMLAFAIVVLEPYPRRWLERSLSIRARPQALAPADLP